MAGLFISFEGGDGAGKSTQVELLADWLSTVHGREVVTTREPGGTRLGAALRGEILHGEELDPRTEALLYAADRAHHVAALVRPALDRGAVVITDRYLDSSVAYQGGGRGLTGARIDELNLWAVDGLLPTLTVLLDLDPVHLRARLSGEPDRLERAGEAFHRVTRAAFLERARAHPVRFAVLDASMPRAQVADDVRALVAPLLVDPSHTPVPPP